jgi:aryl-alcohol dehydrogenase-like predicted oxidoreductase
LAAALQYDRPLRETALHYVLSLPCITSAIIGFATPEQVDEAVRIAQTPPLSPEEIAALEASVFGQLP